MSPRTRARVKAVGESRAMKWVSVLTPIFLAAFAVRQSREAKQDTQMVADNMGALVQDNAASETHHQADDRRLYRLEREVALLKARLGPERRGPRETSGRTFNGEPPAATADDRPATVLKVLAAPFTWAARFLSGG